MMTRHRVAASLLLLATAAAVAQDGSDPNLRRGLAPGAVYRVHDIDAVNEFNGNLTVRIPIGLAYPVGPLLKQQLMLSYNTKLFDYEYVLYEPTDCEPDHLCPSDYRRAVPETFSNAGFGWIFGLGRLVPPRAAVWGSNGTEIMPGRGWFFRDSDGAEHDFTHANAGEVSDATTTDGSFLRLKRHPAATTQPAEHWEVEFPDGTTYKFNAGGDVTEIRDRSGHWIRIDYSDPMKWQITHGSTGTFRTIEVRFGTRTPPPDYTYADHFKKVVRFIDVPAFDGSTATYEFQYTDSVLPRAGCGDVIPWDSPTFTAPLLTKIILPDGSAYVPGYNTTAGDGCTGGLITSMRLPTHGTIEWSHEPYSLPTPECSDMSGWVSKSPGVGKRTVKDTAGAVIGQWTYESKVNLQDPPRAYVACGAFDGRNWPHGPPPTEVKTTVTVTDAVSTVKQKTERFFSGKRAWWPTNPYGYRDDEYGLPFIRRLADPSKPNRFLSSRVHDAGGTLLRSKYVTYEGDTGQLAPSGTIANARVAGELTIFEDDAGCGKPPAAAESCRIDVDRNDYDGYGHYRKTVTASNFGPTRTAFTNYLPNATTWILGTYDQAWVQENGITTKQLFTFDAHGLLKTRRILRRTATTHDAILADNGDLLEANCRDSRGFLTSQRFFGGDQRTAALPSSPCSATPGPGEYQIDHAFTFDTNSGAPTAHTTKYLGTTFFATDADLNVRTGLVSKTRDSAGVVTEFKFDTSGRLESVRPTGQAWTTFEYNVGATPLSFVVRRCPSGAATCPTSSLTEARYYYDGLGRLVQQRTRSPGNQWSASWTTVDVFGREETSSVAVSTNSPDASPMPSGTGVWSRRYDVLGRLERETRPDDSYTTFLYTGNRQSQRSVWDRGAAAGVLQATEKYDAMGRLVEVAEEPIAGGGTILTSYGYDAADRLTSVGMKSPDGVFQARVFDYDGRGFLRWESHPEAGMTSYTYDSRGHVVTKHQSAAASHYDLQYTYDSAERLQTILARNPYYDPANPSTDQPQWRVMKTFTYATENGAGPPLDYRKGKLVTAARYNYPANTGLDNFRYKVAETYQYTDPAGRKTKRTTAITRGTSADEASWWVVRNIDTAIAYDDLDLPASIEYPKCIGCALPAHQVQTYAYDNGRLTAATGFVSGVSYHANGLWHEITRTNQVKDTQTVDATGMPRPASIEAAPWNSCTNATITKQPVGGSITTATPSVHLTVSVAGSAPFSYEWWSSASSQPISTQASYTASPTATTRYWVVVTNGCKSVTSEEAVVSVGECVAPTAGASNQRNPNGTYTLSTAGDGTQPITWAWSAPGGTVVGTTRTVTIPAPAVKTTYTVTASNGCAGSPVTSNTTVTPPLSMTTTELRAAWNEPAAQISVTWPPAPDAANYAVERRSGARWESIASTTGTTYTDGSVVLDKTYAYRVVAVGSDGERSPASNADVATTRKFVDVVSGSTVSAASVEPMLVAVNSVRAAVGWPAVTWSAILSSSDPSPTPAATVMSSHVLTCRARMNEALQALGVPAAGFSDADLRGTPLKAVHINQVMARTR